MKLLREIGLVMLICVSAVQVHAGGATSGTNRSWLISAYGGLNFGGPSQDMEDAMSESGFDARSPGGFGSFGADHPFTSDDGGTWMLAAIRSVKRPFSVGVADHAGVLAVLVHVAPFGDHDVHLVVENSHAPDVGVHAGGKGQIVAVAEASGEARGRSGTRGGSPGGTPRSGSCAGAKHRSETGP